MTAKKKKKKAVKKKAKAPAKTKTSNQQVRAYQRSDGLYIHVDDMLIGLTDMLKKGFRLSDAIVALETWIKKAQR